MSLPKIVKDVLEEVPSYSEFMFVNELYESSRKLSSEHGDIVELTEIGYSRCGLPMQALIIHGLSEEKRVLAFGFPHPNEPIGSLTLDFLSWKLARDREFLKLLNATWVIVKVADVCGALLNEGWFKGVFDIEKYALNYYRPPGYKQVEWSFPVQYKSFTWDKPTDEAKALMRLIDEWKPTHIYSLHNAGFTGTYYYVSRPLEKERMELLKSIPRTLRVPIHRGEPEAPYMEKLDEAIFRMPGIADYYDWLEKHLKQDPSKVIEHGGSSFDYARRVNPNVFELVCEVPYIYDYKLDIDLHIGVPRRDILRISLEKRKTLVESLEGDLEKLGGRVSIENPFYEALSYFIRVSKHNIEATENWIKVNPELSRSATLAQAFNAYTNVLWTSILLTGLLYRTIGFEAGKQDISDKLKSMRLDVYRRLKDLIVEFNGLTDYYVVQPKYTVSIQLASIITTLL